MTSISSLTTVPIVPGMSSYLSLPFDTEIYHLTKKRTYLTKTEYERIQVRSCLIIKSLIDGNEILLKISVALLTYLPSTFNRSFFNLPSPDDLFRTHVMTNFLNC